MTYSSEHSYDGDGASGFRSSSAVKEVASAVQHAWGLTPPDKYESTYRKLDTITPENWKSTVFGDGVRHHTKPLIDWKPRLILPGHDSFSPENRLFLSEAVAAWNKDVKVDVDDDGFTRTGVPTDASKLLCPAGAMQSPMSAKLVDNTLFRRTLKLSDGYTARQQWIADTVWDDVWSTALPSAVNVPEKSDGGMPRFTSDRQWKLDYTLWKTQPDRYGKFLSAVERGDAYGLANDLGVVFGMNGQRRLQLDEIGKDRWYNSWRHAMTGGREGTREKTFKEVYIKENGVLVKWEGFSAMRVRNIDAGPWAVNGDLQIVATAHMRAMFKRYPTTFHVNTPSDISAVVEGKYVYCSDVSEYDQSMSKDAIATPFNRMRNWYPEGLVRSAERLMESPYYTRPLEMEGTKARWAHSPFDWNFKMNSGNRSGHAFTSLIAKVNKVIETLFILDHIYHLKKETIFSVLKGHMPIGLINNGDDEVIWFVSHTDYVKFKTLRSDLSLGHYVVTPETGQGFSGLYLVRPDPTVQSYVPSPRPYTAIEKMYIPERDIGSALRKYWAIGWYERLDNLRASEVGLQVLDIHDFYFRKHLEPKLGRPLADILNTAYKQHQLDLGFLSEIDKEVLADPSKLHYKYGEDDVSPRVLNALTVKIPVDYCEKFLRNHYKGTFI